MKIQSALAMMIALGLVGGACSNGSGGTPTPPGGGGGATGAGGAAGPTSGAPGAAGAAGSAAPGSCTNVTACGGDVVGSWTASSPCLKVEGPLDISNAGLAPSTCIGPTISGSLSVSGPFSAASNGTFTDGTTTSGMLTVQLPAGCKMLSGTTIGCSDINVPMRGGLGFESVDCKDAATGGGCTCAVTVNHQGSMGQLTPDAQANGNYTAAGNTLTLAVGIADAPYDYCVSGGKLSVTPKTPPAPSAGTIELQMGSGAGGGTGGGGAPGTGGAGGAGTGGGAGPTAGAGGSAPTAGAGGVSSNAQGPCDVYAAASTPCVAAYSTIRRLYSTYTGPLYQVRNGSSAKNTGTGGMTKDILMTADGFADTAPQDTFCAGTICTVSKLYDQSGNANHIGAAKKGNTAGGQTGGEDDYESSATKGMLMVGGHKVYSLYMDKHEGYRLQAVGAKMPKGSASQGVYELADGTHVGTACCWDFGNVTTNPVSYGTMNTLFFGNAFWGKGAGDGPWFMADFEAGVWAGGSKVGDPGWGGLSDAHPVNPNNPAMKMKYALGFLKTSSAKWALRSADATKTAITTSFEGAMPKAMDNLGGIVLGVGGDNSNNSWGTFYEGAIVSGYPATTVDDDVLKNIQTAGYGK